jgi:hypothetical protein
MSTFTYTPSSVPNNNPIDNFVATGTFFEDIYELRINGILIRIVDVPIQSSSITFPSFNLNSSQFPAGSYTVTINGVQEERNYTTSTQIQVTCFVKGTEILCADGIKKVENIEVNDEVVTYNHGNKKVKHILSFKYTNDKSMSQICKHKEHPLFITGGHSILVDELSESEKQQTMDIWNELKMVDDKFLLLAFISDKFEKLENENEYDLYHIVLENDELDGQYGIYADNILTETMSINCYNTCVQKQGLMVVNV